MAKYSVKKNYGFTPSKITQDNHVLGGIKTLGKKILNPERDWIPSIPAGEIQQRKIESNSCIEFGTLNGYETLSNKLFGSTKNYSERFLAIASENTEDGNDPHKVCQAVRHFGLVKESSLPFDDSITSWNQFMSPNPLTPELKKEGEKWLEVYKPGHEWVFTKGTLAEKQEKLLEALQYSPIGISVTAWKKRGDLYVKDKGDRDNHWCLLVAGEKGKPWMVYDSYLDDGNFIKELDWNYDFEQAKLLTLDKASSPFKDFLNKHKLAICGLVL